MATTICHFDRWAIFGYRIHRFEALRLRSVTKVFTSLLLADMTQRGEVSLDDPVAKYLPRLVTMPQRNGRSITLIDLATHTSGLPRVPGNMAPKDAANPYADYSVEQLYEFLCSYQLTRDVGSQYEYSNLGGGLLGTFWACELE